MFTLSDVTILNKVEATYLPSCFGWCVLSFWLYICWCCLFDAQIAPLPLGITPCKHCWNSFEAGAADDQDHKTTKNGACVTCELIEWQGSTQLPPAMMTLSVCNTFAIFSMSAMLCCVVFSSWRLGLTYLCHAGRKWRRWIAWDCTLLRKCDKIARPIVQHITGIPLGFPKTST